MNGQIFAYGMIAGALVVGLLWWATSRRKPAPAKVNEDNRDEAERQRDLALSRAELAELEADQQRAAAFMYERRLERLGNVALFSKGE